MRRILSTLCLALCFTALSHSSTADAQQAVRNREYDIKAGYFFFFGGYVQWPSNPFQGAEKEFVIGVLGSNPFGTHLRPGPDGFVIDSSQFRNSIGKIQRKRIKVIEYDSVDEFEMNYRPCHILFISRSSAPGSRAETVQERVSVALQKTKGQPVLLVGEAVNKRESESIAASGVTICYWNDLNADRLKMIINRQAERNAQLTIRAPLLHLSIVTLL